MSDEAISRPPSMAGTDGYPSDIPDSSRSRYRDLGDPLAPRRLLRTLTIAARTGLAFQAARGQIVRVQCHEGPQVADLIVFNADDTTEKFWASRTRVIHGSHLTVGDQLWSAPLSTRPMLTVIADTMEHRALPHGARSHDLLFCRCDSKIYELVHKRAGGANCNDNLAKAIAAFGLKPDDVHDPFNIFMTTGLNDKGKPFYLPSASKKGDYVDLIAEMNVLIAISACPGGSSGPRSYPLQIDIFETT